MRAASSCVCFGVTVQKSVTAPMMLVALDSPHGTYDAKFLANYAYINLADPLSRLKGIANIQVFGSGQYAMRIWVNPDKMAKLGIAVADVTGALAAQNTVNPAGQIGGQPAPPSQQYTYSVRAQGRLVTPEQFGDIVVRETPDGGIVRLRDIARIDLGTPDYSVMGRLNGRPSAIIAVYQLPGSNALEDAGEVHLLRLDDAAARVLDRPDHAGEHRGGIRAGSSIAEQPGPERGHQDESGETGERGPQARDPVAQPEDLERGRGGPVLQRRLLEVLQAVQARRQPVAARHHLARDLGVAAFVGVEQIALPEVGEPGDAEDEQEDGGLCFH